MGRASRDDVSVEIPGGRLHGRRTSGNPPALLLHGGPGLPFTYLDGLLDEVDGVVGAISYQQRGLSPSSIGGPYSVRSHVADAVALLDGLEVDRAWMIGHSWGGYLAMAIAALAPERTIGWIAIDPLGLVGDGGVEDLGDWLGRALSPQERARFDELDREEDTAGVDGEIVAESLRICWPYYFADPSRAPAFEDLAFNPRVYEETMAEAMAMNEQGELVPGVIASGRPGLVLTGGDSGLRRAAEATAEAVGARLAIVEGSGHFPWIEAPGSVREAVAGLVVG